MKRRPKKKIFRNKMKVKPISIDLEEVIEKLRKNLQINEEDVFGNLQRDVTFLWASDELAQTPEIQKLLRRLSKK